MPWYALVSLSLLSLLSLTILLCYFYHCCFYYCCYYFIVTDLYKTVTSLSFSLLLSLYISLFFSLLLLAVWCESNPAHTVTVVYFSLLLLAVWWGSNSVHRGAVVYSCLWLSFSLREYTLVSGYLFPCYCWLYGARVIQPIQSQWSIFPYYCWLYGAGVIQSIQTQWYTLVTCYLFLSYLWLDMMLVLGMNCC